jgi:rod shape-determining protein MreC
LKTSIIIITAVLVLAFSFFIFTNTSFFVNAYAKVKCNVGEVAGPTLKVIGQPANLIKYLFDSYINLIDTKKENNELKKKLGLLQLENQRTSELEKENKRLKSILHLVEQNPSKMLAARVIGEDIKNWFRCIVVDKGRNAGITEKMPVITPKGLVGQAVEVNKWHSKVMIVNDTNSSVDVYIEGKNSRGILEGTGQTTIKLKYVLKNDEVAIGDKVITSGKDSIYPKGLPTGIIITVNRNKPGIFADIDVMPFNNFKSLDEVLIIKKQ